MNPPVLLLTATINPKGMTMLQLADAEARKLQYLQALRFFLQVPEKEVRSIVFAENSGSDLSSVRNLVDSANLHHKQVEVLSLGQNDYPRELGKGYGEFQMTDAAMEQSRLLASCDAIVKLTGRLIVRNLPAIVRRLPEHYDLICDAFIAPSKVNGGMVDSRLFVTSRRFYELYLAGLYRRMDDSAGFFAEHALFNVIQNCDEGARLYTRLPAEPRWGGASGSTGQLYDSLNQRLKWPLKTLRRRWHRWLGYPRVASIRAARPTN